MKLHLLGLIGGMILATSTLNAGSFSITDVLTQTVGTTAAIPGSGTKDNTNTWATGVVGTFALNGGAYYLRVSATNPTGILKAGTDSLMVARTVNSQGLTDQGTLSVYVNTGTGAWSLDLTFEFFNDVNFTSAANVDLLLTSLDIDYNQKYYTKTSDFDSVKLYQGSTITSISDVPNYLGYTAAGDSTFNDPTHAVSSFGANRSSFNVRIAHNNVALYMFEFRDPSSVVPEPSAGLLAGAGALVLALKRRKRS